MPARVSQTSAPAFPFLWPSLLFVAALGVRLLLLPAAGNVSDITGLALFGAQVAAHGPHTLYDSPEILRPYYVIPPVFPFLLGATYWLWGLLTGAGQTPGIAQFPGVPEYPLAAGFVKLWAIAGDLALGGVVYRSVASYVSQHELAECASRTGHAGDDSDAGDLVQAGDALNAEAATRAREAGRRWGLLCASTFLLNPGIIYDSAWWGQIESLLVLCVALSLVSLLRGQAGRGGAWLALGLAIKPQAVVAAPIVGLLALVISGRRGVVRALGGGALVALAISAPFWGTGRLSLLAATYTGAAGIHPQVSVNAYNLWVALSGPSGVLASLSDLTPLIAGLTFRHAGLLLLMGYTLLVLITVTGLWRRRTTGDGWLSHLFSHPVSQPLSHLRSSQRDPQRWFLAAAALYAAFFMLPTQIHERYLYPAVALLPFALARRPLLLALYGALSLGFFVNLIRVVPWQPEVLPALDALGFSAWRTALANVIAFVGLTCVLVAAGAERWPVRIGRRSVTAAALAGAIGLVVYAVLIQLVPRGEVQPVPVDGWLIALGALVMGCVAHGVQAFRQRGTGTIAPWTSRGESPW